MGDTQYLGGYHDARGGYHEYRGGCSVPLGDTILCNLSTMGDIMMHVGDIMSTVGSVQYHGGTQIRKDFFPHGTEHPKVLMMKITLTVLMISPTVLNTPRYSRYPHIYHDIPTVLSIPHGTQDILPHSS